MDNQRASEKLQDVVIRVLEDAAFVLCEPVGEGPPWPDETVVIGSIAISGCGRRGRLDISACDEFTRLLAANLLGVEPDDPDVSSRGEGALGELSNIVAGAFLNELFGSDTVCGIGIPVVRRASVSEHQGLREKGACSLSLHTFEDHRIDVVASLRSVEEPLK